MDWAEYGKGNRNPIVIINKKRRLYHGSDDSKISASGNRQCTGTGRPAEPLRNWSFGEKPLPGPAVNFSHGDVDAHQPIPGSLETFIEGYKKRQLCGLYGIPGWR